MGTVFELSDNVKIIDDFIWVFIFYKKISIASVRVQVVQYQNE
jgi:hypothetical protein